MKKIISLALVFVFVFALAIPAFAEVVTEKLEVTNVPVDGTYQDQTGNADVTYNVSGNYIVTVPDAISLTATAVDGDAVSGSMLVKATKVLIPFGDELRVAVGGNFNIIYDDNAVEGIEDTVNFKITAGGRDIVKTTENKVILTVNEGGKNALTDTTEVGSAQGEITFTVTTINKPKYNESYKGTITFTTSVVTYTSASN